MSEIEKQEAKGRKRNVQINIRISEAEAEQLRKKVEQSGMSQQEYILSCVLNKPITNTDGIKELIPELKRVGNNLNQIAHALNGGRYYQYNLITDNQKELDKAVANIENERTMYGLAYEARKFNGERDYVWPLPTAELDTNKKLVQHDLWK